MQLTDNQALGGMNKLEPVSSGVAAAEEWQLSGKC